MYQLKMLFFADRYHIRHFGYVASQDKYKAMRKGPVAHITYNALQGKNCGFNAVEAPFLHEIVALDEYSYKIAVQDEDELSDSYKEALDFAIKTYGQFNHYDLSEISHDYPEWKKHEKDVNNNPVMDLKDFFENSKDLVYSKKHGIEKDPYAEDEEFLQAMKDDFDETSIQCCSC